MSKTNNSVFDLDKLYQVLNEQCLNYKLSTSRTTVYEKELFDLLEDALSFLVNYAQELDQD